uniref:Uncharacterized protein n=1 Tax=Ananas comosus var. bracteatus TaxID=296719 RepID=A0A6V7PHW7_ANACO|nr:unnamed protein product [Ananas comosus var. bracteatus]
MTRVLQDLDQNSHRCTARLDAVLVAITAFNENIARIGIRVAQYEQFRKENNEDRPRWSRNKDWNKGKEKNISFVEESSAQDEPNESDETEDSADEAEIYAAEIVNMVDIKGKAPVDRKTEDDVVYTKRILRLCIRCKAEMTRRHWEAIIHEKKLYGKRKEFMAFPEEWADMPEAANDSE